MAKFLLHAWSRLQMFRMVVRPQGKTVYPAEFSRGANMKGGRCSRFCMCLDDPAPNVDRDVPKPVYSILSEMVVRDREPEPSFRAFLVLEYAVRHLLTKLCVGERRPGNEGVIRNELRTIQKLIMRDEEPFPPTDSGLVDLERVNADLGLEEGGGNCGAGERGNYRRSNCCTRQGL